MFAWQGFILTVTCFAGGIFCLKGPFLPTQVARYNVVFQKQKGGQKEGALPFFAFFYDRNLTGGDNGNLTNWVLSSVPERR